jgi:eukaryotic-like serine/threonine-protein kinase
MDPSISHTIIELPEENGTQLAGIRANRKSGSVYEGFSIISRGGMGTILKTTDLNIGRDVAMKMAVNTHDEEKSTRRLLREAKITANLEHPNIIPVHEINCNKNDDVYYTMKLVHGDNLGIILENLKNRDPEYLDRFSLNRLLNIFLRICDGVAFAHSKDVIHRDLKPENIMIGDYGEVLIMDWGIAKVMDQKFDLDDTLVDAKINVDRRKDSHSSKNPRLTTHCGEIFGTPAFMAPEQIRGENDAVNEKADIYALGGILYNILALQFPCEEEDLNTLFTHVLRGDIKPPHKLSQSLEHNVPHILNHQVPEGLSAVAMQAMEVNEKDRYKTVKALQEDIRKFQDGFATEAEHASHFRQFGLMVSRNTFFVMVLLLIVSLTVIGYIRDRNNEQQLNMVKNEYKQNIYNLKMNSAASNAGLEETRGEFPELLILAEDLLKEGKIKEAKNLLSIIIASGQLPQAYYLRGLALEQGEEYKNAVDSYRSALRRNPQLSLAADGIRRCTSQLN